MEYFEKYLNTVEQPSSLAILHGNGPSTMSNFTIVWIDMDLLKAKAFYSYRIVIYYNIGEHHMIGLHPKCLFKIYFSMENMNGIFFTSGA